METYENKSGDSSVEAYEFSGSSITIKFSGIASYGSYPNITWANIYKYTYTSAGETAVETMKDLAKQGKDLNTYINKNKPSYEDRWEE